MKKALLYALCLSAALATPCARAGTVNFNFSFANFDYSHQGGQVTGIVRGLSDSGTSAATSVEILSNSDHYGLGEYVQGLVYRNTFTVSNNAITSFWFASYGKDSGNCCTLWITNYTGNGTALHNTPFGGAFASGTANIRFTLAPVTVPEPQTLALSLLALAGAAFVRHRTKA